MKEVIDEILAIDSMIRFVGIVDCKKDTLMSKMNKSKRSLLTPMEEEKFALNLEKIRNTHQQFDTLLGQTTFIHVMKEKIQLLIYYVGDLIIYTSCEPYSDMQKIFRISSKIERVILDNFDTISTSKVVYKR